MRKLNYDPAIEQAIEEISQSLTFPYTFSRRSIALLLLQQDEDIFRQVQACEAAQNVQRIRQVIDRMKTYFDQPLAYIILMYRQQFTSAIVGQAVSDGGRQNCWNERMSYLTMWPITGIPLLLLVLYIGLYQFVGQFGAGIVVDYLEETIFGIYINPFVNQLLAIYIPWESIRLLFGGEYGIITLGFRYAIAIVLPIVGTFFIAFSILEDSGYLPRLAMLVDRVFKCFGLNGRAVIPMVLGLGCGTMATMVTRTLETARERLLATFLLALAVPCSAQLGLILGLLAAVPRALPIWCMVIGGVFVMAGTVGDKMIPGHRPAFYMEIPPLRMPNIGNVLIKSYTRMHWYILEILPLFVLASVLLWLGNLTGGFVWLVEKITPISLWLGLPPETAQVFLFGFFRRDYGAAGLYDLVTMGLLNAQQLLITATILTLFVPCVAQFTVMVKERGWQTALTIALIVFPFAFGIGFVLNKILALLPNAL
jgi:ferrous iron transport protein B